MNTLFAKTSHLEEGNKSPIHLRGAWGDFDHSGIIEGDSLGSPSLFDSSLSLGEFSDSKWMNTFTSSRPRTKIDEARRTDSFMHSTGGSIRPDSRSKTMNPHTASKLHSPQRRVNQRTSSRQRSSNSRSRTARIKELENDHTVIAEPLIPDYLVHLDPLSINLSTALRAAVKAETPDKRKPQQKELPMLATNTLDTPNQYFSSRLSAQNLKTTTQAESLNDLKFIQRLFRDNATLKDSQTLVYKLQVRIVINIFTVLYHTIIIIFT
jgi:hypothetical protein